MSETLKCALRTSNFFLIPRHDMDFAYMSYVAKYDTVKRHLGSLRYSALALAFIK